MQLNNFLAGGEGAAAGPVLAKPKTPLAAASEAGPDPAARKATLVTTFAAGSSPAAPKAAKDALAAALGEAALVSPPRPPHPIAVPEANAEAAPATANTEAGLATVSSLALLVPPTTTTAGGG